MKHELISLGNGMYAPWVYRSEALFKRLVLVTVMLLVAGCATSVPENIKVVRPFDIDRYLGQWFEIARLDHSFERNMNQVSATYSRNEDGSIKVVNRGFDTSTGKWREAVGRAEFIEGPEIGALRVSFFGPFYGGYFIVALDQQDYQWVMIVGNDLDYFWILSRNKTLDVTVRQELLRKAREMGIATDKIIWVEQ